MKQPRHKTAVELERLRKSVGWTKTEMARRVGANRRTIWRLESQTWAVPKVWQLAIERVVEDARPPLSMTSTIPEVMERLFPLANMVRI